MLRVPARALSFRLPALWSAGPGLGRGRRAPVRARWSAAAAARPAARAARWAEEVPAAVRRAVARRAAARRLLRAAPARLQGAGRNWQRRRRARNRSSAAARMVRIPAPRPPGRAAAGRRVDLAVDDDARSRPGLRPSSGAVLHPARWSRVPVRLLPARAARAPPGADPVPRRAVAAVVAGAVARALRRLRGLRRLRALRRVRPLARRRPRAEARFRARLRARAPPLPPPRSRSAAPRWLLPLRRCAPARRARSRRAAARRCSGRR